MLLTLIIFIIVLSVLVLIHEAGHFFSARKLGIRVEEFGFGFPPRVFGIKRGDTIYSINALPIGGFVKLYGEDEAGGGSIASTKVSGLTDKDLKEAFFARPAWQRAWVIFAGVVMNVILAFIIFYVFLFISGFKTTLPLLADYSFHNVNQTNYDVSARDVAIASIAPNSPADKAHMVAPLVVTEVDGKQVTNRDAFIKYIDSHKGKPVTISWKEIQSGQSVTKTITPRLHPPKDEGSLGVAFVPFAELSYSTPVQKIFSGVTYSYDFLAYTFVVMEKIIAISIQTHNAAPVSQTVSGPVGIFVVVEQVLQLDHLKEEVLAMLSLVGALSLSLAFFNVLPIPALDGGRLFFVLIELVTRHKVNPKFEAAAHAVGLVFLLGLLLLITVVDISKLL